MVYEAPKLPKILELCKMSCASPNVSAEEEEWLCVWFGNIHSCLL